MNRFVWITLWGWILMLSISCKATDAQVRDGYYVIDHAASHGRNGPVPTGADRIMNFTLYKNGTFKSGFGSGNWAVSGSQVVLRYSPASPTLELLAEGHATKGRLSDEAKLTIIASDKLKWVAPGGGFTAIYTLKG
jgi:hypothetical protein